MKVQKNKFSISNFPFYIIITPLLLLILSCSPTTEIAKGELSGVVNLEGMQDHSGIIVALYELAYLDTTITRINQEYPHIGVIINQHTEFDHRLQSPVKMTQTEADGSFEIKNIPTGIYNFIAIKDSFGFKYLYEIVIEEGNNEISQARCHGEFIEPRSEISTLTPNPSLKRKRGKHVKELNTQTSDVRNQKSIINNFGLSEESSHRRSTKNQFPIKESKGQPINLSPLSFIPSDQRTSDITLYPEVALSGVIQQDLIFQTDHHYVIEDDCDTYIAQHLEIQPGAIVRINPGVDFTINGTLKAQGEENNMFWVTSNDGFGEELIQYDLLQYYNQMELSSVAVLEDDFIEWGKWDCGNTCLLNQENNLHFENVLFRNSIKGSENNFADTIFVSNLLLVNCTNYGNSGIILNSILNGEISNNVFISNYVSLKIKDDFIGNVFNNYFVNNALAGLEILDFNGNIRNNEFYDNENDILYSGNDVYNEGVIQIEYNNLNSNYGIIFVVYGSNNYNKLDSLIINDNNFYCNELFVSYYGRNGFLNYFNCDMNFFNGLTELNDIMDKFYDEWDELYEILPSLNNIYPIPINETGIQ